MTRSFWEIVGFLPVVAILFTVSAIQDEVHAVRDDRAEQRDPAQLPSSTPRQHGYSLELDQT